MSSRLPAGGLPPIRPTPNHLLQTQPAAELEALVPRLGFVELVRETVLVEAGSPLTHVYLPHSGAISMMVRLSEGQPVEVATTGRDSVFGAGAALGSGISLTSAVVVRRVRLRCSPLRIFRRPLIESVTFRAMVARHEQALLALAHQSAACNASHSVEARPARRLLRA